MNNSSGTMPLGILAAIRQEAAHQVKSGDRDEILFAQRRVLDLVKECLPAVDRELIEELRKDPHNSFRVIAERNGESITATYNSANWEPVDKTRTGEGIFSIAEAARKLHTYPGIIRDRMKKDPKAIWFTTRTLPGLKRQDIFIVDIQSLERLLPSSDDGRYSITEAAAELGIQRAIVNACVNRNIDKPWVVRELVPGKKRADRWITDLGELKKSLDIEPRGFTPAQAAKETGLPLSEIKAFVKQHPDSPNLERTGFKAPTTRIIDADVLKRDLAIG